MRIKMTGVCSRDLSGKLLQLAIVLRSEKDFSIVSVA